MTTMTRLPARSADAPHRRTATASLIVLTWLVAATLVAAVHGWMDHLSATAGAAAAVAVIVAAACLYNRLCAPWATTSHALGVGISWLVLSIGTEIGLATRTARGWYGILGSPDHPLLRTVLLFAWIFTPVLFVRNEEGPDEGAQDARD